MRSESARHVCRKIMASTLCLGLAGFPSTLFAASKLKPGKSGAKSHREISVIPLAPENTVVKAVTYNTNGSESERMVCNTNAALDPNKIADVTARVVTSTGHFEYTAHYQNNQVRQGANILRYLKGQRFADITVPMPDEENGSFQKIEGPMSRALYFACQEVVLTARSLETYPTTNGVVVRAMDPGLTEHLYQHVHEANTRSARQIFLDAGSQQSSFLRNLGLD